MSLRKFDIDSQINPHMIGWISFEGKFGAAPFQIHDIGGATGKKFDRIETLDLDGDGDADVLTCEENEGPASAGLGVIWYENPLL